MLRHFRRSLEFVWPLKRYLVWSVLCLAMGALMYSASIGSVLPVLKVMVEPEGLHGWLDRCAAQSRLGVRLDQYNSLRDGRIEGAPEHATMVRGVEPWSPLAGKLRPGDVIVSAGAAEPTAVGLYQRLALHQPGQPLELGWVSRTGEAGVATSSLVTLPPAALKWRTVLGLASLIPREQTYSDRLWTLMWVLGLVFVFQVVGNAFRFGATYLTEVVAARAIVDLRRVMARRILSLPLSHYSLNVTDTMSRFLQDTQELKKGYTTLLEKMIREPLRAVFVLILALLLDWRLTAVLVVLAPPGAWLIRRFGKKVRRANLRLLEGYSRLISAMEGVLVGMRIVKGYATENYERKRLFAIERQMLRAQLRMERVDALSSPVVETLGFLAASACIVWLGSRVLGGELRPADFASTVIMIGALFDPLRKLSNTYVRLQRANAAAERIFQLIDLPGEEDERPGAEPLPPLQRTIEFREVWFTYPRAEQPALRGVNLTVRRGEVVALVGPNGSGKTTLVSLLLRFFEPQKGCVLIDGRDIGRASLRSLRRQICLISQETIIFGDTMRANIAYGKHGAGDGQVREAARRAFAEEFIARLPQGYDTLVGEHGATLSGGQRQRIALARAILRDAPILVFDEATSQIDTESELKIQQALEGFLRGRTAFIIAHRFATISRAERIAVMDDGRIVAVGTHRTLLESCPLYARLYETQFRDAG